MDNKEELTVLAQDVSQALQEDTRKVAEAFFRQYIDLGVGAESEQIINALADLISCGGNLTAIRQQMALELQ